MKRVFKISVAILLITLVSISPMLIDTKSASIETLVSQSTVHNYNGVVKQYFKVYADCTYSNGKYVLQSASDKWYNSISSMNYKVSHNAMVLKSSSST